MGVRVAVLGPSVAVAASGRPTPVGGRAARTLSALAMRPGQFVPLETLVEAVWPVAAPTTARKAVLNALSDLRQLLGHDAIERGGDQYRLTVPSDVGEIEAVLHRLRAGEDIASERLRELLDLWRGDVLVDLAGWWPAEQEAARLALVHEELEDRWVEAELVLGHAEHVLAPLETMVSHAPLREHRWVLLLQALQQAGRQADALRAFQRARRTLAEEAGVAPGAELLAAEAAVVATLSSPPETADGPAFVGRVDELMTLRRWWGQAARGGSPVVVIEGDAGVGKTRLAEELARSVRAAGDCVVFAPAAAFRSALAELAVAGTPGAPARTPSGLARALGFGHGRAPSLDEAARAVGAFLDAWAAGRRGLIVLDDVHDAGEDAFDLMAQVIARHRPPRCAIVLTARPGARWHAWLHRVCQLAHDSFPVIELGGLSRAECFELLGGRDDELFERSQGNPLWALTLQRWRHRDRLPPTISGMVRDRLAQHDDDARTWAQLAALVGSQFDAAVVGRASGVRSERLASIIDRLTDDGIIARSGHLAFAFTHPLLHEGTVASIPPGRGAVLHRAIAEAMQELGVVDPDARARHLVAAVAVDPALRPGATRAAAQAGEHDLAVGLPRRAEQWFRAALDLHEADDGLRCDLLTGLGQSLAGRTDTDFRAPLIAAGDLAHQLHDPKREARALLAANRVWAANVGFAPDELLARLRRLRLQLHEQGEDDLAARLAAVEAAERFYSPDWARRLEAVDAARTLAQRSPDPATRFFVAMRLFTVSWDNLTVDRRRLELLGLVDEAEAWGDRAEQAVVLSSLVATLAEELRLDDALPYHHALEALGDDGDDPHLLMLERTPVAFLATLTGDVEGALRRADEIRRTEPINVLTAVAVEAEVARSLGRWRELDLILTDVDGFSAPHLRALAAAELGDHAPARELLSAPPSTTWPSKPPSMFRVPVWCALARLVVTSGPAADARTFYRALAPLSGHVEAVGQAYTGDPIDLLLALLAARSGRWAAAQQHVSATADAAERVGNPIWRAKAAVANAVLDGDVGRIADAEARAHECGIEDLGCLPRVLTRRQARRTVPR